MHALHAFFKHTICWYKSPDLYLIFACLLTSGVDSTSVKFYFSTCLALKPTTK